MIAPIPALAAIAINDAAHGFTPARNRSPAITMASAVTEPTDRSMPPEISKIVMPTTTMASTENAIVIARMLGQVRKYGEAKDIIRNRTRMIRTSPVSRAPNRRDKREWRCVVSVICLFLRQLSHRVRPAS